MSDEPTTDTAKGIMIVGYFVLALIVIGLVALFLTRVA